MCKPIGYVLEIPGTETVQMQSLSPLLGYVRDSSREQEILRLNLTK